WSASSDRADAMADSMPAEALTLYAAGIAGARSAAKRAERDGLDPERVAEAIAHALTAPRPRTRYLVGNDAKLIARLVRHLPDRARDRVLTGRRRRRSKSPS
ncbi:MAG: hypothetical protein Q8M65_00515, partial [Rhodoglobus sp.]|nr:hypothetical protein [Rhodoglobus sp.]